MTNDFVKFKVNGRTMTIVIVIRNDYGFLVDAKEMRFSRFADDAKKFSSYDEATAELMNIGDETAFVSELHIYE